jgi:Mg-chelatase subunit ChlD
MPSRSTEGQVVGDYTIVQPVGQDQQRVLYLASKGDPNWLFWLVESHQQIADISTGTKAEHFQHNGAHYLAMPVAGSSGATLFELVGALDPKFIVPLWATLADNFGYVHQKGQVHQRRGPFSLTHIIFSGTGQVMPLSGASITPDQFSCPAPELEHGPATPASDVYALGAALVALLGADLTQIHQPKGQIPQAVQANEVLLATLQVSTALDPEKRFQNGRAMAVALLEAVPAAKEKTEADPNVRTGLMTLLSIGAFLFLITGFFAWQQVIAPALGYAPAGSNTATLANGSGGAGFDTEQAMANLPAGDLIFENIDIDSSGEGSSTAASTVRIIMKVNKGADSLSEGTVLKLDVRVNGQPVAGGPSIVTANREGTFVMEFTTDQTTNGTYSITATAGDTSVTKSIYHISRGGGGEGGEAGDTTKITTGEINSDSNSQQDQTRERDTTVEDNVSANSEADISRMSETEGGGDGDRGDKRGISDVQGSASQVDTKNYEELITYFALSAPDSSSVQIQDGTSVTVLQDDEEVENFTLTMVDPEAEPLTVAIIIDVSGSMEGAAIEAARMAAANFVGQFAEYDIACVYTFSTVITHLQDCSKEHLDTITQISTIVAKGDTALYDVLFTVASEHSQLSGRQVIVLLSDGADTASKQATLETALTRLKESNIPLYAIGLISEQFDGSILERLAGETGGIYLEAPSTEELSTLYDRVRGQLDNQYRLAFDSLFPERQSGTITIRLEDQTGSLEIKREFFVQASSNATP